jgi:hypothetical protein
MTPTPQAAALQVAQPINDTQLVALVAAQLASSGYQLVDAVDAALELVARACVAMRKGALNDLVLDLEARKATREEPPPFHPPVEVSRESC